MAVDKYTSGIRETRIVHAGNADGDDRTLCGDALEGDEDNGFESLLPTHTKITCELCIRIITHCKAIRASEIAPAREHTSRER